MVSPGLSLRMLFNIVIQPLERALMGSSAKGSRSPSRPPGGHHSRDCPLDVILNERKPDHPVENFSSTALNQTRAFSASGERRGRAYQLVRRPPKKPSTITSKVPAGGRKPGVTQKGDPTTTPTSPPSSKKKRSRSVPVFNRGVVRRGRANVSCVKAESAAMTRSCEEAPEALISPCLGTTTQMAHRAKSAATAVKPLPASLHAAVSACNQDFNTDRVAKVAETPDADLDQWSRGFVNLGPIARLGVLQCMMMVNSSGQ